MEELNNQLQNIRFQLKNMDSSFENMAMLMQNMGIQNFGSKIQNFGIQMLNMGIQMLDIGIKIPNNEMNNYNIKQQILNIETKLKNIEIKMNNNMGMQTNLGMPMTMQMINIMGLPMYKRFGMPMNKNIEKINENNNDNKIRVLFITTVGMKKTILFDYGTTVSDMLRKYFEEIEKPELFKSDKIIFVFNAFKINYQDQTKIEDYFKGNITPTILVNDIYNLIENNKIEKINENNNDNKIRVQFMTTAGMKKTILFDYGTTVSDMLRKYFEEIEKPELFESKKITFLFNASKIDNQDQTKIEDYFKGNITPIILVNDTTNLID